MNGPNRPIVPEAVAGVKWRFVVSKQDILVSFTMILQFLKYGNQS
jgi:hypothetical protein